MRDGGVFSETGIYKGISRFYVDPALLLGGTRSFAFIREAETSLLAIVILTLRCLLLRQLFLWPPVPSLVEGKCNSFLRSWPDALYAPVRPRALVF